MFRLAVDTPVTPGHGRATRAATPRARFLWIVNNIYFQYYSLLIFLVSSAVMVGVSYATAPPAEAQLAGLTFATVTDEQRRESRAQLEPRGTWSTPGVVLALILLAYLYFNG